MYQNDCRDIRQLIPSTLCRVIHILLPVLKSFRYISLQPLT